MGIASSKADSCEALRLCKERKKFIKKAIDLRYDFAAAHLAYVQSLRSIGIALRRFAEAEVLLDSSSATEIENPQTHSSSPSTSPPHLGGAGGVSDGSPLPHHHQSPVSTVSYMRSGGTNAVTVSLNPSKIDISTRVYVDDVDSMSFTMPPPPPPPPPESASNWDYFDHADDHESFSFVGHDGFHVNFNNMTVHKQFPVNDSKTNEGSTTPPESLKKHQNGHDDATPNPPTSPKKTDFDNGNDSGSGALICRTSQTESKDDSCLGEGESEDPSEFITHRAKDFLSSIKEIESRFFLTSESGKEVSRMLEVNKIQVGYSETKGSLTASTLLCGNCCKGTPALVSHDPTDGPRIITWKRSMSSHSSSSRNPLAASATSKDGNDEIGIDFIEEFCMIAGSHSSTLDRLYAWERKLYDEVKASECIRKEYDRKCERLRHQFAKDLKTHVIDKTRALVKDLHSRIIVALHTVDSISKRIEKMRDEELQPQLLELIQGLNRMWKAMLESHHTQYITIQLAYHLKTQKSGTHQEESKLQIMADLQREIQCFGLSFINLVNSQTSYVESINNWLKNCIIQPKERVKGRRPFSPRRALGPPIFVICRDWSSGIQTLPAQQLSDAIKGFLSNLNGGSVEEVDRKLEEGEEVNGDVAALNLGTMQLSLTKVLDGLTKFSEASLKMYEDIKEKSEKAQNVYLNYRPPPRAFSI